MSRTNPLDLHKRSLSLDVRRGLLSFAVCTGILPLAYAQGSVPAQDQDAAAETEASELDLFLLLSSGSEDAESPQGTGQANSVPVAEGDGAGGSEVTGTIAVDPLREQPVPDTALRSRPVASTQLEEIVVTATKRSQSVRDIPMSIDVLTGDKLAEQGARELQDFVDQVPGLQMQDVAVTSSRKIVIRGIAPDNTTNQTVGMVLGDVPLGDPIGSYTVVDPDTWDLQTIEVLKGPQGTLFGAASLAGIIRYVPMAPQLDVWQGKAFTEWMSVKDGGAAPTFGGAINVPVGSELAFRLSGVLERRPGVIDIDNPARQGQDADDARKWSGRAMALWAPTERLTINAWYTAQERRADEAFFVTNFDADYTRYDAPESSPSRRYFDLSTLDVRYDFDWATLVSMSAYQNKENRFDFESSYAFLASAGEAGISVARSRRDVEAQGLMQELRLVSPDGGDWTWQAGVFYSRYEAEIRSDIYTPVPNRLGLGSIIALLPAGIRNIISTENGVSLGNQKLDPLQASESALFGEVTRSFGALDITLGGRLYQTEVSGVSTTAGLLPFLTNRAPQTVQDLSVKGQGFSPKIALSWQASDDVTVYGGASRGFQYGGVNAVAVPSPNSTAPATYRSSALWAYEIGVRSDWLDGAVRADLAAYYQQWSDAQVSQVAPPAEAYINNVGDVEVQGVELSLRYLPPLEGLTLEASGGYLDSRTAAEFMDSEGNLIPVGTQMPNAPRLQASAAMTYARTLGDVWATMTGLQYTHVDRSWGNIEHTGKLDARDMLNFNFSVTRPDLSFMPSVGLIVNNITDERRIVSATEQAENVTPTDALNYAVGYTRPRTVILRLSASFE